MIYTRRFYTKSHKGLIRKEKPGIYVNTNHPVKQKSLPNFLERLFYGQ